MDVKDVSGIEEFSAFFQQLQVTAEQARSRKGQIPHDHPSPGMLVGQFNMERMRAIAMSAMDTGKLNIKTSQVPSAYLPCSRTANELQPLSISKMRLEEHHRGKYVIVRTMTSPRKINVVMTIVEDEEGTAALLQLYNQPEESAVDIDDLLPQHSVCLIKEPFFKVATDGKYSLRVDHVGDFCLLSGNDGLIPSRWRSMPHFAPDSEKIRLRGNTAVGQKKWGRAEKLYTEALAAATTTEQERAALLNRSLANLRLQRPEKALLDAIHAGSNDPPSEKGLFREAKAYYALEQFDLCAGKLQQVLALNPSNKDAEMDLERTGRRIIEQVTGGFKWKHMHKQSKATPPMIDCATYSSPVEVRDSPGRGRGLFTTKAVKAGDLLLCEKAFSYIYADHSDAFSRRNVKILMNLDSKKMTMGGQATLISTVIQKLYHNPEAALRFMGLHHGDYKGVELPQGGQLVVDTFLVERIISLNCFGAPRTTLDSTMNKANQAQEDHSHTTCGVWTIASFINHSCLGNCYRSFIGDMMIVRACSDLDAGTELLFSYKLPKEGADYQATQDDLKHWSFICRCGLCEEKKATSKLTFQRRQGLVRDLKKSMRACRTPAHENKVLRLLSQVESTYPGGKEAPHLETWEIYLALGQKRTDRRKLTEGLELIIKGLEALGFEIVAFPRGKASGKPTLEIKSWGQVNKCLVSAFLSMFHAYKVLAPELCEAAKGYAETVYAITFGEKDTIGTLFKEFK
ncbi:tpr domain-containing protein [Colletotrichum incanum]|uniref:Tpr domain-containing protein n=1 Tax=Colletotrichum incanum TaxID=1573173 RepID=A0A166RC27_COLIC|nr:tpr domain-containing protein [Colletotrichum incanum]